MKTDKTILVIDDDADLLAQTSMALEGAGYNVIQAMDSIEAEQQFKSTKPDLVLADIVMEEVDAGLVFAEKFGDQVPVIVLSSIAQSSEKVFDISSLPVKGVLQKPVSPADLLEKVRAVLNA